MTNTSAMPRIDLNPHDWDEVNRILRIHVPGYEVWAFGSRVTWSAKQYSDLDLAVITKRPLPLSISADLKNALAESSLSIKVDVVDWATTAESFRRIIEKDKVVVQMPQPGLVNWIFKRLIDCTRDGNLSYGIVQPGQHDEEGIPIVRVNNVNSGQLRLDDVMRVSPEIEAKYKRTRLEGGEVLLTLVGSTGQSVVVPNELAGWNIARAIAVIRPRPEIGANWINICLQSKAVQQFLDERANTTVQKTLNLGDVKEVPIPIPPKEVKDAIESIAMALANKIELNRRMNETLEAIARAMFKSWFVDFDPVRAKMNGEPPESICQRLGLTPDLLALFPDRLVDSERGEIPEGWKDGRISDVAGLLSGYAFKSKDWVENGVPVVKIGSVKPGIVDLGAVSFVTATVADQAKRFRLCPGDLLIGMTGYVGEVGLVPPTDNPPLLNQRVGKFILENPGAAEIAFLYCLTRAPKFKEEVVTKSHGTAQANVSAEGILSIPIIVPPKMLRDAFNQICYPLFVRILENHAETSTLSISRDTLLPKLLSGELRVPAGDMAMEAMS